MIHNIKSYFEHGIIDGDILWTYENQIQSFCKVDMKNLIIEVIDTPYYMFTAYWMFVWGESIYAVSLFPSRILYLNKTTLKVGESVNKEMLIEARHGLSNVFQESNRLILVPMYSENCLWYYDMAQKVYSKDNEFFNYTRTLKGNSDILTARSSFENSNIYAVIYNEMYAIKYNIDAKTIEKISFAAMGKIIDGILVENNNIWLTVLGNSNIYRVSNGQISEITVLGKQSYSNIVNTKEFVVVLPRWGVMIVLIDKQTLNVYTIKLPLAKENQIEGPSKVLKIIEREKDILIFPHEVNKFPYSIEDLMVLDKTSLVIKTINIRIKNIELYNEKKQLVNYLKKYLVKENSIYTLDDYLNVIILNLKRRCNNDKFLNNYGRKIYEICSDNL